MYISRIRIKRGPVLFQFAKSDIRDSLYAAHQLLWKAFPRDAGAKRDFLFRQEDHDGLPCFFVVSSRRPENHELFQIETKEYSPQIATGQQLAFSLTANPIVARKTEGKKYSAKHDVWMDAKREAKELGLTSEEMIIHCNKQAKEWLTSRAESLGFRIVDRQLEDGTFEQQLGVDRYFQHQLYRRKKGRAIRFSSICYEGILMVGDPDRVLRTLYEGVGRSRSFGCGLMMVRRVSRRWISSLLNRS